MTTDYGWWNSRLDKIREQYPVDKEELNQLADQHDTELLEQFIQELRRTQANQLDTLSRVGEKAERLLELNGLVLTVILSVSTQMTDVGDYMNWAIMIGLFLFLSSMCLSWYTTLGRNVPQGLGGEGIEYMIAHNLELDSFFYDAIQSYTLAIETIENAAQAKHEKLIIGQVLFILAVLLFAVGVLWPEL